MKSSLRRLFGLCFSKGHKMIFAVVLAVISFTVSVVPYYMVYRLIVLLSAGTQTFNQVIIYIIITLVAVVIRVSFFIFATSLSHRSAFEILHDLRIKTAKKLISLPLGYFSNKEVGATKKTITEDIERLELFIAHNITEITGAITSVIVTTVFLFFMDWRMALVTFAILPIIILFYSLSMIGAKDLIPRYNKLLIKLNSSIIEYTRGMQVIKAFGLTASSYKKLSAACAAYAEFQVKWAKATFKYFNVATVFINSGVILIFPVGIYFYSIGTLSLGMLLLFLIIGLGYSQPLTKVMLFMHTFHQVSQGEMTLNALLNESSFKEPLTPKTPSNYSIEFCDVDFSYEKRKVLNKISLTAKQGEITALVGASGAGKTTIGRLIPRFWDVNRGKILIGGVDIRHISSNTLMSMVSFVFQDVFLFNISLKDNIRLGKDNASDSEIIAAARAAQCHDFIMKLPNGYETYPGLRGVKISGGEKQRISLARAILKDSPVIIFDEATSSTDPENEDRIQEAVSNLVRHKTVIVISHNLSSIVDANKIIVIDKGEAIAFGNHKQLLNQSEKYCNMWENHRQSSFLYGKGGNLND